MCEQCSAVSAYEYIYIYILYSKAGIPMTHPHKAKNTLSKVEMCVESKHRKSTQTDAFRTFFARFQVGSIDPWTVFAQPDPSEMRHALESFQFSPSGHAHDKMLLQILQEFCRKIPEIDMSCCNSNDYLA